MLITKNKSEKLYYTLIQLMDELEDQIEPGNLPLYNIMQDANELLEYLMNDDPLYAWCDECKKFIHEYTVVFKNDLAICPKCGNNLEQ